MENTINNQMLVSAARALAILAAAALLGGCGSTVKSRLTGEDLSSYDPNLSAKAGAECNTFDGRNVRLTGKVTTYYASGTLQEDRVRVRITGLTDQFDQSSNYTIKVFRWKAFDDNTTQIDSVPLNMIFEAGASSSATFPISGVFSSFNVLDIAKFRQNASVSGTTTQSFFDNTVLVVTGVDYTWDALKIVIYNGSTVVGQADMLLPIFAANPNTYALTHPDVLKALHPFWSQRDTSATDRDWVQRSISYCF